MHLLLQRFNGGIDGSQLALQPIPPEAEHGHLALLMLTPPLVVVTSSVAAERREHGDENSSNNPDGFQLVPWERKCLAVQDQRITVGDRRTVCFGLKGRKAVS